MTIEEGPRTSERGECPDLSLFVVVKPDGGRYLRELEETLRERQISIISVYCINDWEKVARSIYKKQLETSSRSFCVGFESHIWLCQYLFGNQGLLLLLDPISENFGLESKVQVLHEARENFRSKFFASNDVFTIAVNLDKFDSETFRGSDKVRGTLGTFYSGFIDPLVGSNSDGMWYRNYFKYIHAPENVNELDFQFKELITLGILKEENKVDREEWEMLKYLRCVIPPSKYIKPNNL